MGRVYTNEFPLPPTANNLFINVRGGRVKSPGYREWVKAVGPYALLKPRFELQGDVVAVYAYGKPSNRRMDVCNREKGVSDILQAWGILKDDSQLVDVRLLWSADVPAGMVRVHLEELGASTEEKPF